MDFWAQNRGAVWHNFQGCLWWHEFRDKSVYLLLLHFVVKEFFSELKNNKSPSLIGFPLAGFSRVYFDQKFCVVIFWV
jgi:hypothetical protein